MSLMERYGWKFIFESNFNSKYSNSMFNEMPFLCDIMKAWSKLNFNSCIEDEDILNQYLWNNSLIRNKGNMLFYKSWLQLGIKKINDIYDSRHKIFLYI